MTLPQGAVTVRAVIEDFFATDMPTIIDAARIQWGIDKYLLPHPVAYDAMEPVAADVFPFIGATILSSKPNTRFSTTAAAEEIYSVTYECKVFVWVRTPRDGRNLWITPEYDATLELRDRLLALMRMAVLQRPTLGSANGFAVVDPRSLSEEYLEPQKTTDQGPQWTCGGTLTMTVEVEEQTYVPILGSASTITVTATANSLDD